MKLKQQPSDFRVEELTTVQPGPNGHFAFYRLEKSDWTTPDALAVICRRWKVESRRLSVGGLKDRHAQTIQYFAIDRGPGRDLSHGPISVTYLGQVEQPYSTEQNRGNRFTIHMRSLSPRQVEHSTRHLCEIHKTGVPNYFDDQRFGGVHGSSFVAREMVLGHFERAIQLAIAVHSPHDRATTKLEKMILNSNWGDWARCRAELPRGHARDVVDYLIRRPTDFRGACARLHPELQGLYLSAWQSHLWNRMLTRWLTTHIGTDELVPIRLKTQQVVMPRSIPASIRADWEALVLPLPSARLKLDPLAPWAAVVEAIMTEEGIPLEEMRIKGLRKPFFSKGERVGKFNAADLTWSDSDDELNPGRQKLSLRFDLPRGCYATMLVKRITAGHFTESD